MLLLPTDPNAIGKAGQKRGQMKAKSGRYRFLLTCGDFVTAGQPVAAATEPLLGAKRSMWHVRRTLVASSRRGGGPANWATRGFKGAKF